MESDGGEEAAATPTPGKVAATPAAGRLKGCPELTVEGDMREMAKTAAWSVSSCKPGNGVASLRDDSLDTYWQSDDAQPHLVSIQFQKKVQLQEAWKEVFRDTDLSSDSEDDDELKHLKRTLGAESETHLFQVEHL
ncbi:anaphase-promoting complex subunit 10-like [Hordeum vulgare subsp. vulgare]|uniref:anaphase-promoting complex subunit 10-like n=1 Tax=Hordeum vulgare subsp. vulgare TaxID=112509 RepID=UPI001D1A5868|nr:anaphase-promoting complex subunit 10-like [Hordeum vulgare subsp. vulgare]